MIYLAVQPKPETYAHGLPATKRALIEAGWMWMPERPQGVEGPRSYPNRIISEDELVAFRKWVRDRGIKTCAYMLDYEGGWLPEHRGVRWWWSYMTGQHTPPSRRDGRRLALVYSASMHYALDATPNALPCFWGLPGGHMQYRNRDWWTSCIMGMLAMCPAWMPAAYRHGATNHLDAEEAPGWFTPYIDWCCYESQGQTIIPCTNMRQQPWDACAWYAPVQMRNAIDALARPGTSGVALWVPSNGYETLDEFDEVLAGKIGELA